MLCQNGKHALHGAENCSVHNDWPLIAPFSIRIAQLEAIRQLEVQLNGCTLELSPKRIKDSDVYLGAIEGPITLVELHTTIVLSNLNAISSLIPGNNGKP